MSVKIELNQIFSTAVLMFQMPREFTQEERKFLMTLPQKKNTGNTSSVSGYVLRESGMDSLRDFAQQCVNKYFQEILKPKLDLRLVITQSWMNWTVKDQNHHKHAHPNSFLSGVLYVSADEKTDSITFYNPRNAMPMGMDVKPREFNVFNSHEFKLPVHTGHLLIFPSCIEHSVDTLATDSVRASLAFNTCPVGVLGGDGERTRLEIIDAR